MTYLGTQGVITYGYPLLPSGFTNFHTIFSFYLRAVPAIIFGLNEFSLRFPSAVFGILSIPLTFIFVREVLKNKYTALLSAVIMALSMWQIEFSREARWYSEFNFFYLASVYFFYLGFIKEKKPFRILFLIFMALTTFINSIGFTLVFLFLFLLVYKGMKGFFKKSIIIHLAITIAVIAAQTIHRNYWKVGISFYTSSIQSDNIIIKTLGKFFSEPKAFFLTVFKDMFALMFYVFAFGLVILVLSIFLKKFRNSDEQYIKFFKKRDADDISSASKDAGPKGAGLPFNISFIYFIFLSNAAFLGVGNMYNQQRYIFFAYVYFIICFAWTIFEISRLLSGLIKKNAKTYLKTSVYIFAAAVIFFATASYMNPLTSSKIPFRKNGDSVDPNFAFSNTVSRHPDTKSAGNYIRENKKEGDIVISMDLLNSYPYTGQFDGWLWSGNLVSWQPYHKSGGIYYDYYFGKKVLRDELDFLQLEGNNLWVHATRSKNISDHITGTLADYLDFFSDRIVFTAADSENIVYRIPFEEAKEAVLHYEEKIFRQEEVIKTSEYLHIDFALRENDIYMGHGWGSAEPEGRWAISRSSYIFALFDEKKDYLMQIDSKPFLTKDYVQKTSVFVNNNLVGEIEYNGPEMTSNSVLIPAETIKNGEPAIIRFLFRYTAVPNEADNSSKDMRNLSVFFKEIIIE